MMKGQVAVTMKEPYSIKIVFSNTKHKKLETVVMPALKFFLFDNNRK